MTLPRETKKLASKLSPSRKGKSVWEGPMSEGDNGGVSYSMLTQFLTCRERFRLSVVEGLRPHKEFWHVIEFGQMWHTCEEHLAAKKDWTVALLDYTNKLMKEYPTQRSEVNLWYRICRMLFPVYVDHWEEHPDVQNRTPFLQEQVFKVPYLLPSGRKVCLRGKIDSADFIAERKKSAVYIQENKTKSQIDEEAITSQLTYDLQTNIYLIALRDGFKKEMKGNPLGGVRYNVVKRPGFKLGKKETVDEFIERVATKVEEDHSEFFARWKVDVLPSDITKFEKKTLVPVLEQLCDWWDHIKDCMVGKANLWENPIHFQHPHGCYNPLNEGYETVYDEYLTSGKEHGLRRIDRLFEELR